MANPTEEEIRKLIDKLSSERLRKEVVVRRALKALQEMKGIKTEIAEICETIFPDLLSRIDKITIMLENIQEK